MNLTSFDEVPQCKMKFTMYWKLINYEKNSCEFETGDKTGR